jgi:hypothetical protein
MINDEETVENIPRASDKGFEHSLDEDHFAAKRQAALLNLQNENLNKNVSTLSKEWSKHINAAKDHVHEAKVEAKALQLQNQMLQSGAQVY